VYIPEHFAETRPEELYRLIRENPLGTLVTHGPNGLDANHIPFEFEATKGLHGVLTGHVARANPVWREIPTGSTVLVIFGGAEGYISPNWYPSKHEQHRQVPTWNYQVVHAHGTLAVRDDERFVRGVVARLTRTHESAESRPWKMGDSAPNYIDTMLRAIVGIEIDLTRLVGKAKLSQNREARDRISASEELRARNKVDLAEAMKNAR
jgi:transcriptional regulator